jgi:hypothetical protein
MDQEALILQLDLADRMPKAGEQFSWLITCFEVYRLPILLALDSYAPVQVWDLMATAIIMKDMWHY